MIKHNQVGAVNALAISLGVAIFLLISALVFGGWSFSQRQHYKNDTDAIVAVAVKKAKQQESAAKDKEFAQEIKKPLKIYNGPESLGSMEVSYPKTWSGYVDTVSTGSVALNGYFAPGEVPSTSSEESVFSLRVQVANQSYDKVVEDLEKQVEKGELVVDVYSLPELPDIVGVMAKGQVEKDREVTMVVLPLRGQTLKIWTDGTEYEQDFNDNILPNFTFTP